MMSMKNKVWTGLLVCALMVCCACFGASAQSAPIDATELPIGTRTTVRVEDGNTVFLSFIPEISHDYDFYAEWWDYMIVKLYMETDGELQEIETTDVETYYSFRIRAFLNAGARYYLSLSYPYETQSGSVPVYAVMDNNLCVSTNESTNDILKTVFVNCGDSVTLQTYVSADYTERITYRWEISEYMPGEFGYTASVIEDENESSLTTANIYYKTYYNCYIADGFGNEENVLFTVDIDNNFSVSAYENTYSYNREYNVNIGESANLQVYVTADNTEDLFCRWKKREYDQETDSWVETALEDETGTALTTDAVWGKVVYECNVADRYGHIDDVYLTVIPENHLTVSAEEGVISSSSYPFAIPGEKTTLQVYVSATDMSGLTYAWSGTEYYYGGGAYFGYGVDCDCTESVLILDDVPTRSRYDCTVTDKYGKSETVHFYLSVKNGLRLSVEEGKHSIQRDIHALYGEKVDLKAFVTANETSGMIYEWYYETYNDETGTWNDLEYIPDATGDTVTTRAITCWTLYSCSVVDRYGNTTLVSYFLDIDNEDHQWGVPAYTWADDYSSVKAEAVCLENESHVRSQTVPTGQTIQRPTETAPGWVKYSASFSYTTFETQSHIIDIPSLGEMRCLHLPEKLTSIDDEAFMGSTVQAVIIPDGCVHIGDMAFANNPYLLYVAIPASVTDMAENAFQNCDNVFLDYLK